MYALFARVALVKSDGSESGILVRSQPGRNLPPRGRVFHISRIDGDELVAIGDSPLPGFLEDPRQKVRWLSDARLMAFVIKAKLPLQYQYGLERPMTSLDRGILNHLFFYAYPELKQALIECNLTEKEQRDLLFTITEQAKDMSFFQGLFGRLQGMSPDSTDVAVSEVACDFLAAVELERGWKGSAEPVFEVLPRALKAMPEKLDHAGRFDLLVTLAVMTGKRMLSVFKPLPIVMSWIKPETLSSDEIKDEVLRQYLGYGIIV